MRRTIHLRTIVLTAVAIVAWCTTLSHAQDPVKVAPDAYKTVFENDYVRVCAVTLKAGGKIAMHSHPDHVVYVIAGGKTKMTYPDGRTEEVEDKVGSADWTKAESHNVENVGTTEGKYVVVELKKPAQPGVTPVKAPEGQDIVKLSAGDTKVLLENERVRVFESRLKAGGKHAMHWHPAHVVYALSELKYKSTGTDGKTEDKTLAAGKAVWGEPINHAVENAGTAEGHALVVELREPLTAAAKPAPEKKAEPEKKPGG